MLLTGDCNLAAVSGNIVVNDTVNWSTHTLTAADSVNVNSVMMPSGTARLVVNTGANGSADMSSAVWNVDTGSISYSYTVANPSGNTCGGVAGSSDGVIRYAYASGNVSGNNMGGLVGVNSAERLA